MLQASDASASAASPSTPCSGYNDICEFVMRLRRAHDDSGVGNAHGDPRIPYDQVERLERLMVRTRAGELSGRRLEREPGDVIRSVGRRVN